MWTLERRLTIGEKPFRQGYAQLFSALYCEAQRKYPVIFDE
jgi:hypothetical protein